MRTLQQIQREENVGAFRAMQIQNLERDESSLAPPAGSRNRCRPTTRKTFDSQCEALSRKTGKRCPHKTRVIYSNVIGHYPVMDGNQYTIEGEGVCLCSGHSAAYSPKKEPLRLIKGCFLKASNKFGYGTRVSDRGGSVEGDRAENFRQWGEVELRGNVPDNLRRIFTENVEDTREAKQVQNTKENQ